MGMVQLQPLQISMLWEDILVGAMTVFKVPEDRQDSYGTALLKNLLSGKFQCWILSNAEDQLVAIGISVITESLLLDYRELQILSLYGYRTLTPEVAEETFELFKSYGRRNNCVKVTMQTNVPRIIELAAAHGLTPMQQTYELLL